MEEYMTKKICVGGTAHQVSFSVKTCPNTHSAVELSVQSQRQLSRQRYPQILKPWAEKELRTFECEGRHIVVDDILGEGWKGLIMEGPLDMEGFLN